MTRNKRDIFQIVIVAAVIACIAFLSGMAGPQLILQYGRVISTVALAGAIMLIIALAVAATFGKTIVAKLFRLTSGQLEEIGTPLQSAVRGVIDGRREDAILDAEKLGRLIFAKYIWISVRRFILTAFLATAATLAGFTTTILLLEQNRLLQSQNEKLDSQNKLFDVEVKLVESQTQLLERQTSLAATTALTDNLVSVRQLFDELAATQNGENLSPASGNGERQVGLVEAFLKKPRRQLSAQQSARLAFVTSNLRPYAGTKIGEVEILRSVERGQVILALHHLNVDLESAASSLNLNSMDMSDAKAIGLEFTNFVFGNASFAGADLRLSAFSGCDFSDCDFRGANLQMSAICHEFPRLQVCTLGSVRTVTSAKLTSAIVT